MRGWEVPPPFLWKSLCNTGATFFRKYLEASVGETIQPEFSGVKVFINVISFFISYQTVQFFCFFCQLWQTVFFEKFVYFIQIYKFIGINLFIKPFTFLVLFVDSGMMSPFSFLILIIMFSPFFFISFIRDSSVLRIFSKNQLLDDFLSCVFPPVLHYKDFPMYRKTERTAQLTCPPPGILLLLASAYLRFVSVYPSIS